MCDKFESMHFYMEAKLSYGFITPRTFLWDLFKNELNAHIYRQRPNALLTVIGLCVRAFLEMCAHYKICFPDRIFVRGTMSGTVVGGNGKMIHFIHLCSEHPRSI